MGDVDDLYEQHGKRKTVAGVAGQELSDRGDPCRGALFATDVVDGYLGLDRLDRGECVGRGRLLLVYEAGERVLACSCAGGLKPDRSLRSDGRVRGET
jgi:hypothetical protein